MECSLSQTHFQAPHLCYNYQEINFTSRHRCHSQPDVPLTSGPHLDLPQDPSQAPPLTHPQS